MIGAQIGVGPIGTIFTEDTIIAAYSVIALIDEWVRVVVLRTLGVALWGGGRRRRRRGCGGSGSGGCRCRGCGCRIKDDDYTCWSSTYDGLNRVSKFNAPRSVGDCLKWDGGGRGRGRGRSD